MARNHGVLFVVLVLLLQVVNSFDNDFCKVLLDDKLFRWRVEVTKQIKGEVLEETKRSFNEETQNLKTSYFLQNRILLEAKQKLALLEAENELLRNHVQKLHNNSNDQSCIPGSGPMSSGSHSNGALMTISNEGSSDIWLLDASTLAKWRVTSPKGTQGISYHPITRTLYVVEASQRNNIVSITVPDGQVEPIWNCGHCIAVGLDPRENILFFLDEKDGTTSVHQFDLIKQVLLQPLLTYQTKEKPIALTVDDVNRHVFVVLGTEGAIEQLDYNGRVVRTLIIDVEIDGKTTFTLAVDKKNKILYFNVGDELWKANLKKTKEEPDIVHYTEWSRSCGISVINGDLVVAFVNRDQMSVWTEKGGIRKIGDLVFTGKAGSNHICTLH